MSQEPSDPLSQYLTSAISFSYEPWDGSFFDTWHEFKAMSC